MFTLYLVCTKTENGPFSCTHDITGQCCFGSFFPTSRERYKLRDAFVMMLLIPCRFGLIQMAVYILIEPYQSGGDFCLEGILENVCWHWGPWSIHTYPHLKGNRTRACFNCTKHSKCEHIYKHSHIFLQVFLKTNKKHVLAYLCSLLQQLTTIAQACTRIYFLI